MKRIDSSNKKLSGRVVELEKEREANKDLLSLQKESIGIASAQIEDLEAKNKELLEKI